MLRETRGTAAASLALAALLWSSAGLLIKFISWDPFAIAGARSAVGLITMMVLLGPPRLTLSRDQLLAALCYSATMILFIVANKLTTSANAVLLQYTEPMFVVILGRWLLSDERASPLDWLAIGGVFAGMVLFFFDELSLEANLGNVLAVASGVTFALTAIFMRRQRAGRPHDSFMLAHVITMAVSLPFILRARAPSPAGLTALALLGVFQMGLPSILYSRGIRGVSAISAAIITMLEPALNPLWVGLVLGDIPSSRAIVGGCIILFCVTGRTVLKARKMHYTERYYSEEH
jgi:drug/metabolite transporter (DMT)-like permease